jgi:hypothetical protein
MTASPDHPSSRPSVEQQIETLNNIRLYNKALPKKRQGKDSLPEITASNIVATFTVKRDAKKKTFEMIPKYSAVGIVDGCRTSTFSNDPFSLTNKQD